MLGTRTQFFTSPLCPSPRFCALDTSRSRKFCRVALQMTQKDLAAACAEKATTINEYESGRAIPNNALLAKIERILGVRLPRPSKK